MMNATLVTKEPDDEFIFDRSEPARIDVRRVQGHIDRLQRLFGSVRIHRATFQAGWPCTRRQYEEARKSAVDTWLSVQERRGFTLRSKVHVDGPFAAYGYRGDWQNVALLDMREFRCRAAFSVDRPKPQRIELYVAATG